ncbi:Kelch repeat-containing protein [Micromonospora musae]|uniref:Galactose oxidase n=1 Tax=Micromonospora musae TaxID=1894970 RepID=A0A3A9XXA0_9ACTN|nr:kelch repeat-containing protein [Micromonospora musae]RKN30090.1 galactose oxidase [Micromonospora musae]
MSLPLRRRRARSGLLGGLTAVLTLSLLALSPLPATPAQAAPKADPSAAPADWEALRYKPAGCNTTTAKEIGEGGPWARCFAVGLAEDAQRRTTLAGPPADALGPADIKSAYRLPDGGEGQIVAIVGAFGYEAAEADLAVFRTHYGLPPCTTANGCFRKVDQRGGTDYPIESPDWSIEAALDLDAVSSACPKCDILLVQADNNSMGSLGHAVDTAARLGADAISNSYGVAGESDTQYASHAHYDHPGIVITVSSGDIGNVQSYPATHPDVLSVGGTLLTRDGSTPRGWSETAWEAAGSGCSYYELRPSYQADIDTHCGDKRANADISATAAPESGLAVYNTLGQDGWARWGGTSLSAPLVAGMYALAGDAVPGTYPVTYPYRKGADAGLFDITEGSNGWCGDLLCTAGPGWDGPTGLGSPNGVSALTLGRTGQVSGAVTSGKNPHGKKQGVLAGVTVTATDTAGNTYHAVTGDKGTYQLAVPAGTYGVVAAEFGYQAPPPVRVVVAADAKLTRDIRMTAIATRTLTGAVTDGSGHGWPVYAKVAIDGYPTDAVYTDPYTGRYSVELPVGADYTLRVSPVDLPGYVTSTATVTVAPQPKGRPSDVRRDVQLATDTSCATAPGYTWRYQGLGTDFTGWSDGPKDGWQVTDESGAGQTWRFDDPGAQGNLTGGAGGFAAVNTWVQAGDLDTNLVSPPVDLTGVTAPVIGFDSDYPTPLFGSQEAFIDLSLDNGATWSEVYRLPKAEVRGHQEIPIPQAAGTSGVQVRFRYQGQYAYWWQLDNVFVGSRTCAVVPGGIIAGQIRDGNTGGAVLGATVSAGTDRAAVATSRATADDAALDDGYYWFFAKGDGTAAVTVSGLRYADATAKVHVARDRVVRQDWKLESGRLKVHPADLSLGVRPGRTATGRVRLTNDGDRPLRVKLVEQDRGYTPDRIRVAADAARSSQAPPQQGADGRAWVDLPDLPLPLVDNVVADNDGTVYSVGGDSYGYVMNEGYVFDPQARAWERIADLPEARAGAAGGFIDGKLYVTGGLNGSGIPATQTWAYDPMTDKWSRRADLPAGVANAAATTVGGQLYVVAGCPDGACPDPTARAYRYDAAADRWTRLADYPRTVAYHACGAAGDGVVCTGGYIPRQYDAVLESYRYFPESDTWVQTTGLPVSAYGMAYATVGGKLRIIGGTVGGSLSRQVLEYDSATAVWSKLPDAVNARHRGGAACGTYQVGGLSDGSTETGSAQQLPGIESCVRGSDVSWLSTDRTELTIPAGRSVTVTVTVAAPVHSGHGQYQARLAFETDSPYRTEPLGVVMKLR